MTQESDIHVAVGKLRDKVNDMDANQRVTKHEVANIQQTLGFLHSRFDKLQEQLSGDLKELRDRIGVEFTRMTQEINSINTKQEKGAGFWAGVVMAGSACIGVIGALLMLLYNQLFGAH